MQVSLNTGVQSRGRYFWTPSFIISNYTFGCDLSIKDESGSAALFPDVSIILAGVIFPSIIEASSGLRVFSHTAQL